MADEQDLERELAPCGTPWWKLTTTPGSKRRFGGEKRLSAYLYFNVEVGELFTMKQLRDELGVDGVAEDSEHLNRRLRNLRPNGWLIKSYKDDRSLPVDSYRLEAVGLKIWRGEKIRRDSVSKLTAKSVMERDGRRCVICGVGAGEEYPGEPGSVARMTIGHRVPGERLGGASEDELQTECAHHNEAARDVLPDPEQIDEVLPAVRNLKSAELRELRGWLVAGRRSRSRLDLVFDRALKLRPSERTELTDIISGILGDGRSGRRID